MKLKVTMDSGKEYIIPVEDFEWFENKVTNQMGVLANHFVDIAGLVIVPTHISTVEEYIEESPKSDLF
jgi:hypothetical protein